MRNILFVVLLVALTANACTHKPFESVKVAPDSTVTVVAPPQDTTTIVADTSVCFQRDVLPIFIASCAKTGCHDAASHADGYNLSSYGTIILKGIVKYNSGASKVYTKCVSKKMPESPTPKLDSTQLSFIKRWIDKGAPNDTNCTVECDTMHFTYTAAIAPILSKNCYGCHATSIAPSAGGSIILDTYTGVQAQAQNGKLLGDLQHASGFTNMPLGGNQLPACQITQVQKWIAAGALNN